MNTKNNFFVNVAHSINAQNYKNRKGWDALFKYAKRKKTYGQKSDSECFQFTFNTKEEQDAFVLGLSLPIKNIHEIWAKIEFFVPTN